MVTHSAAADDVSKNYRPLPLRGASAGASTSMYLHSRPIFSRLPSAFSSMVVRPPAMLPLVGCESDRSSVLCASMTSSWYDFQTLYHLSPTFLLMARARAR